MYTGLEQINYDYYEIPKSVIDELLSKGESVSGKILDWVKHENTWILTFDVEMNALQMPNFSPNIDKLL